VALFIFEKHQMRVIFLGSDKIALPSLRWLAENSGRDFTLVGVVCGRDRRGGRGMRLWENPIAALGKALAIEVFQPQRPREELLPFLRERRVDLGLVFAYGHLLRREVLESPSQGFVNLHASLLPELRGPSPIETAILLGMERTGLSLMRLVEEMDGGPLLAREALPIGPKETGPSLREKLGTLAVTFLEKHFSPLLREELRPTPQDSRSATFCRLLKKEDGLLDFSKRARDLEAQVRAFAGWPGSYFLHRGEVFRVGEAELGSGVCSAPSGTFLGILDGALAVATGEGVLRCLRLQLPCGKMLPADRVWGRKSPKGEE
jgi:methionyl-tRNA formyltransferase